MSRGHCPTCGATFRRYEIGYDWLGREVLTHRCDPDRVHAFRARHERQGITCYCDDCGTSFVGMRRWRALHKKRCVDCSKFAPQGKKRCRKCARAKILALRYGTAA